MKPLTPRQRQIVSLMAQGKNHPEIARDLGVSAQTVKNLLIDAYRRLEIETASAPGHLAVARFVTNQLPTLAD